MATVRVPVSALLNNQQLLPRQRTPRRRPRTRRQPRRAQVNNSNNKLDQLQKSVENLSKLVIDDKKKSLPKEEKFYLVKQASESSPQLIVLPEDKKDARYKMGKESIVKLANEIKRLITAGAGSVIVHEGEIITTLHSLAPINHLDFDMLFGPDVHITTPKSRASTFEA